MIEDGKYPLIKLRIILLHLLNINSEIYYNQNCDFENDLIIREDANTKNNNEEMIFDNLEKFWS
jgi:hypothetical protein